MIYRGLQYTCTNSVQVDVKSRPMSPGLTIVLPSLFVVSIIRLGRDGSLFDVSASLVSGAVE